MSTPPHGLAALDLGGAEVDEVLHDGEKSVLARGRADGRPVVIKALRSDAGLWRSTFARELQLYRIFATHPPPARVPELLHTDGHALLDELPPPAQPAHGDPLPSNLLITEHGECGLVDFEFTGLLLPRFDLAMLHTLLATTPEIDGRIQDLVRETGIETPFLVNQAIVLARRVAPALRAARQQPPQPHTGVAAQTMGPVSRATPPY